MIWSAVISGLQFSKLKPIWKVPCKRSRLTNTSGRVYSYAKDFASQQKGSDMRRIIISIVVALALLFTVGCDRLSGGSETPSTPASLEIVRQAEVDPQWLMTQMKIQIEAGREVSLVIKLSTGEKVDGYFYLEDGSDIGFDISGNTPIYQSKGAENSRTVNSDRFSFVASQEQGNTYALTFHNTATGKQNKVTVFLEVIYPVTGSVFVPIDIKLSE